MDCKHAYFKDGIQYVLCDCGGAPKSRKLVDVTPHMCAYQRFCPNIRTCALLPEWVNCPRLKTEKPTEEKIIPAVTQTTAKKKKA